ncbi:MAG: pyridoxine 5'-phosphate synthase [Desulfobacterales bacterium]|nr:pyridoxine 5'-phosphate synthase [Desulfobacterales bacterium]
MAELVVNLNYVAALRGARKTSSPDPVAAAVLAELAGAGGVSAHLRAARKGHIKDRDVRILANVVQGRFILEMAATSETVGTALDVKPSLLTLIPESREPDPAGSGVDLMLHGSIVGESAAALRDGRIPVCVFIDPDLDQIKLAHRANVEWVQINTRAFCQASGPKKIQTLPKIVDAVKLANRLKLKVMVAGGLCHKTIKSFKGLKEIDVFNIGHGIVARAVLVGMERAVAEMISLIKEL